MLSTFLSAYQNDLPDDLLKKTLAPILSSSKSTNPVVHGGSVVAFSALLSGRSISSPLLESITNDLLALPKSGKTASPDHRHALYSMLGHIKPQPVISSTIALTLPTLLAKESSEAVLPALRDTLSVHFAYILDQDETIPKDITAVLVKETAGPKASVRRAFLHVVGIAFNPKSATKDGDTAAWSNSSKQLAEALLPSLETDLKAAVAAPLNAAVGPLEGYVAVATFVHPLSPIPKPRTHYTYLSCFKVSAVPELMHCFLSG